MVVFYKTSKYQRERNKFVRNNPKEAKALIKTLENFSANPSRPSLNLEKLSGVAIWTIRINKSNRIFFHWIDKKTALLIDIGKHDKYRRY